MRGDCALEEEAVGLLDEPMIGPVGGGLRYDGKEKGRGWARGGRGSGEEQVKGGGKEATAWAYWKRKLVVGDYEMATRGAGHDGMWEKATVAAHCG